MDRVNETQFQVGENSDWKIWRLRGQKSFEDKKDTQQNVHDSSKNKQIQGSVWTQNKNLPCGR